MRPFLPLLFLSSTALAHGAFPITTTMAPRPGAPDDLLIGTSIGPLISEDRGQTWRWICEESVAPQARVDPLMVWMASGNILAGDFFGLSVSTDRGCSFRELPELAGLGISDIQRHPTLPEVALATTSRYGKLNAVYRSTDEGLTFKPLSLARGDAYFSAVRVAPSQPSRLYASAWYVEPVHAWLYRSDDDGTTWTMANDVGANMGPFAVLAVSPVNPSLLLASVTEADRQDLWRSEDAGATFTQVLTGELLFEHVVFSADGQRVFAATNGALFESRDQGLTFTELSSPANNVCAFDSPQGLLVCGAPFLDGFAAGREREDGGFSSLLAFHEVKGVHVCPAGTPTAEFCPTFWPALAKQLETFAPTDAGVRDGGSDAGVDGGVDPQRPSGCGCQGLPAAPLGLFAAVIVGVWRRRHPR